MKKIPPLTHLQFLIIDMLRETSRKAVNIIEGLNEYGEAREGSAFYQLMGRLEKAGLLKGTYVSSNYDGRNYRERFYEATKKGRALYNETLDFYANKKELNV